VVNHRLENRKLAASSPQFCLSFDEILHSDTFTLFRHLSDVTSSIFNNPRYHRAAVMKIWELQYLST